VDGDSITTKAATSIFTEQFLTFLSAVQIAINNDMHLKAKVVITFSDLQKFFIDKGLSPGQIVSILSAFITNIMQEKSTVNILDGTDSFM
jgi:ribosome-associated toxin RatA of RatAB toxin-antitoxin module